MAEGTGEPDERRATHPSFRLTGDLAVEVLVPMGEDHLAIPATVVELADNTVTIDARDGAAALRIAIAHHSVLVWGPPGEEHCALVRSGRRIDDVRSPTTLELVIEEVKPLAELDRAAERRDDGPSGDGPVVAAAGVDP